MNTKKLKQLVLDLAIHGKLVPQDPNDEPASELLKRIVETHGRASNIVRASNKKSTISSDNFEDVPFEVPEGWVWCRLGDICDVINGSTVDKILEKEKGQVAYYFSETGKKLVSKNRKYEPKNLDIEWFYDGLHSEYKLEFYGTEHHFFKYQDIAKNEKNYERQRSGY